MFKKSLIISILLFFIIGVYAAIPNVKDFFKNELKNNQLEIDIKGKKIVFTIHFAFSHIHPSPQIRRVIYKIAEYIKKFSTYKLFIEGHTDNIPVQLATTKIRYPNLKAYSIGRAEVVKKIILYAGIRKEAVNIDGAGDKKPVASNDTAAGRAKNRRVEIVATLQSFSTTSQDNRGGNIERAPLSSP